jgi:hypothetical protein
MPHKHSDDFATNKRFGQTVEKIIRRVGIENSRVSFRSYQTTTRLRSVAGYLSYYYTAVLVARAAETRPVYFASSVSVWRRFKEQAMSLVAGRPARLIFLSSLTTRLQHYG